MSDFNSIQNDNYYGNEYDNYEGGTQGANPAVRPMVDPNATGEVDIGKYPEPKDSTKKIRGRYDFLDMVFTNVNQELLIAKTFYFFFFSAFGSLFPLMGIYFKQMGMNPMQCGILIGLRPFIEFPSAPFWGNVADRYRKGKIILMTSLSAWILFTSSLSFIQPPAVSCVIFNSTHHILTNPHTHDVLKRSVDQDYYLAEVQPQYDQYTLLDVEEPQFDIMDTQTRSKRDTPLPKNHVIGKSPHRLEFTVNYNENEHETFVSPPFSTLVYRYQDVQKVFFLAFLLIVLGEFFSCPAITLADSAVITYLGDEVDKYGRQRMFGSVGWGICMFFVGIALDHSTAFPDHPCGPHEQERNYTICFAVFSVLMGCALITATQMKFDYGFDESLQLDEINRKKKEEEEAARQAQVATQVRTRIDPNTTVLADDTLGYQETATPNVDIGKSEVFAQTSKEFPQWVTFLKQFHNVRSGTILFVAWWMGFGIGLIFTFLFWHLQDYGGTPTLFGVASVINHISEIFAYFFSFRLISQIGHVKVLCLGLVGNVLRFLYISWIRNPWWVLPFEFIQGITHAAVWAACCSYLAHTTPPELRASAQGVLQGLHHGLGRGCGAVIGGLMVNYFGTQVTFRGYGVMSLLVLALFVFINFFRQGQFQTDIPQAEDPHQVAEAGHLDPHGVPANPMPRALSSSRLQDLTEQQNYGSTNVSGTHLEAPNAGGNPFLSAGNSGGKFRQYSGNNYDQLEGQLTSTYGINASLTTSPDVNTDQDEIAKRFQEYDAALQNIHSKNPFLSDMISNAKEGSFQAQSGW